MKKIAYISTALALVFTMACGGNNENSESEEEVMMEETDAVMDEMADEIEVDDGENEREITIQELPEAITTALGSTYEDYTIDEVEEITAEDGVITYEIELKKGEEEMDVIYSADGQFLGIEEDDDDEDDEGDDHEGHDHD